MSDDGLGDNSGGTGSINLDTTPTGDEEVDAFADPNKSDAKLDLAFQEIADRTETRKSFKQDRRERKQFASVAKGITQSWIGFLMVVTFAQMTIRGEKLGLTEHEFMVVFTTTTASVFGFWVLVGRYLFPGAKPLGSHSKPAKGKKSKADKAK